MCQAQRGTPVKPSSELRRGERRVLLCGREPHGRSLPQAAQGRQLLAGPSLRPHCCPLAKGVDTLVCGNQSCSLEPPPFDGIRYCMPKLEVIFKT